MATRISLSQLQNKLRQIEAKQKQAINRYNQEVRRHNQRIQQAVRNTNTAISKYNQEVRAHNSRVRADQHRLRTETARLNAQRDVKYVSYRESVIRVTEAYEKLDSRTSNSFENSPQESFFADLSEKEAANTVSLFNSLEQSDKSPAPDSDFEADEVARLQGTVIEGEIREISEELDSRWRGALFSLHPKNPEAARHFCTSVREIFTEVLDQKAPDELVFSSMQSCERTPRGNATRRSKIEYLLSLKEIRNSELSEFVDENVSNIVELFSVLNGATHGESGRLSISTLHQVKKRVEDGLLFICRIAA